MKNISIELITAFVFGAMSMFAQEQQNKSVTVPFMLDHNRMLVEVEIQRKDGTWQKAKLWVDSGNPKFYFSEHLARDLGIEFSGKQGNFDCTLPAGFRIGGKTLNTDSVDAKVMMQPFWLFSTMHNDANLPSTVLMKYHIIIDYSRKQLTIAEPGSIKPHGVRQNAHIHPKTGIVQIDAVIDGDSLSFALDNGASYSFVSDDLIAGFSRRHLDWPVMIGTLGSANMWGWWPANEQSLTVMRVPEIFWGAERITNAGMVGVPRLGLNGPTLGEWYSQKTAHPVDGFLGANILKSYRIEIDYMNSAVYFEKCNADEIHDMDIVGLTIQPQSGGEYLIIGVSKILGKPAVEGVEIGDKILQIDQLKTTGATMGTVIDALRGKPGEFHVLTLERDGKSFTIKAKVDRFL